MFWDRKCFVVGLWFMIENVFLLGFGFEYNILQNHGHA
jgi:hypothetical protein